MGTFLKIVVSTCYLLIRALQYSYIVKGHCCPHYIGSFLQLLLHYVFVCLMQELCGLLSVALILLWHCDMWSMNIKSGSRCGWPGVFDDIKKELLSEKTNSGEKQKVGWMRRICEESQCWHIWSHFFGRLNFFGQDLLLNHHIPLRCRMTPRRTKQCVCTVKKLKLIFFVSDYS